MMQGCAKRLKNQRQPQLAEILIDLDGGRQRNLMRSIQGFSFARVQDLFQTALQDETAKASEPQPLGLGAI